MLSRPLPLSLGDGEHIPSRYRGLFGILSGRVCFLGHSCFAAVLSSGVEMISINFIFDLCEVSFEVGEVSKNPQKTLIAFFGGLKFRKIKKAQACAINNFIDFISCFFFLGVY